MLCDRQQVLTTGEAVGCHSNRTTHTRLHCGAAGAAHWGCLKAIILLP